MSNKQTTKGHKPSTTREPSDFGKNLERAREELAWTRHHLSMQTKGIHSSAGIHENTIYNIERGKCRPTKEIQRVITEIVSAALARSYPWGGIAEKLSEKSLTQFIQTSDLVSSIDHSIAAAVRLRILPAGSFVGTYMDRMSHVGISSLADLERQLKQYDTLLIAFGKSCLGLPSLKLHFVPRGLSIALLQVLLLLKDGNTKTLLSFLAQHSLDRQADPKDRARDLTAAFKEAKKEMSRY